MRPPASSHIAAGVAGLRTVMVNVFFVSSSSHTDKWVLIDGGLRGCGPNIAREASRHFGDVAPSAVLLTHAHFDHVGALPWLLRHWPGVPVYAHREELAYVNGHRAYARPDPSVGGGLLAVSSLLYPRRGAELPGVARALPEHGAVPELPEWQWVPTPGHTPGHVSFWRASDGVLVAGDALISTRQESAIAVWRQTREVRPPPAYYTTDWPAAYRSMVRLRELRPKILAGGHGVPLQGEAWRAELDQLLAEFPQRGLPKRGRYVPERWPEPVRA